MKNEENLRPYAEPVPASELLEGSVYFSVNFFDDEMLVPELEPVVFVGRNLSGGDPGKIYFQDFGSYQRGVVYGGKNTGEPARFFIGSENRIGHIFEYDQALDVLKRCASRREQKKR